MKQVLILSAALAAVTGAAQAASTTTPYEFTEQAIASTGQFEWDEFDSNSVFSPAGYAPDVAALGVGSAALVTADFAAQPFDGPPVPIQTSTGNIYAGGTLVGFDLLLSGLDATEAATTVVLQVGIVGELTDASILLDGAAPTTLVDRGVKPDVAHGAAAALFDTRYYWAEWQVASATDYLVEFTNAATHTSLAQVRADYFNTAAPFAAVAAGAVPEPASAVLACLVGGGLVAGRGRRGAIQEA